MRKHSVLAFAIFACLAPCTAQVSPSRSTVNLDIQVRFADGGIARGVNVQLITQSGSVLQAGNTRDDGRIAFTVATGGRYRINVSGPDIATVEAEQLVADGGSLKEIIVAKLNASSATADGRVNAAVSALDLEAPAAARHEFERASSYIARGEWSRAEERLKNAVAIFPRFVSAYANLGAVYSHLSNEAGEQQALQRAIDLDHRFWPALANLGRFMYRKRDFAAAEDLLSKAAAVEPDPNSLMWLADSEFFTHHYDAAVATARRAHDSSAGHPTLVHYIAGYSYAQLQRFPDAIAEFGVFLKEEPTGPRADRARDEIAHLQQAATQPIPR